MAPSADFIQLYNDFMRYLHLFSAYFDQRRGTLGAEEGRNGERSKRTSRGSERQKKDGGRKERVEKLKQE